jgi:hypothetical protein
MNPELHHKWNAAQDKTRESGKKPEYNPAGNIGKNTVLLKQNRPK